MSTLFEQASLVMIPSGYKEDVVYSVKPTDGSGDLTFTRASDGTRVNSQGLVERVPWNLLQYSEQFDNAAWTKFNSSVTANDTTSPDGTANADKLIPNAVATSHQVNQSVTGAIHTLSVFGKAGEYSTLALFYTVHDGRAVFDLSAGTITETTGTVTASIEDYGNGWYRCILSTTLTTHNGIRIYAINGTTWADVSNAGNGTSGIYIWGAQINEGTLKPYFPTTDRLNVPRLDYSGGCPSLLLEPQTTALNQYSQEFDNAYWIKGDVTISANTTDTLDPSGQYGADKIVETSTTARHRVSSGPVNLTAVNHTASVFLKKGTAKYGFIAFSGAAVSSIVVDLENGSITDSSTSGTIVAQKVDDYGNGWYRLSITALGTSSSGVSYSLQYGTAGSANPTFTANIPSHIGSTSNNIYAWGANLTATSYVQSYIPTTSASVTRVADAAYKTGISSLIGQTEGALFVEFNSANLENYTQRIFTVSDDTNSNVIGFQLTGANQITFYVESGGVNQVAIAKGTPAVTLGENVKIAAAYKANDFVLYVNGVQIGTDTSGSVPATSVMRYANPTGNNPYIGKINQALIFKTRLTNAELAAITTL